MSSPVVGRISYALGALSCDTVSINKQLKYGKNLQDPTSMILQTSIRGALRNSTGMIQQDSQSGYLAKRNVYRKTHTRNHSIGGYSEMMTAIGVHMDPKANNNEPEKTTELTMNLPFAQEHIPGIIQLVFVRRRWLQQYHLVQN